PLYATDTPPASDADKMGAWATGDKVTPMTPEQQKKSADEGTKGVKYNGIGQHGFRNKVGDEWKSQPAELDDWPTRRSSPGKKNSGQVFETTALAIDGTQKDSYYGSVRWGWERNDKAEFKLVDFDVVSRGTPSAGFLAAADKWNKSKTSKNEETID